MKKSLLLIIVLVWLFMPITSNAQITFGNTGITGLWEQNFDGMGDWKDNSSRPPFTGTHYGMTIHQSGQAADGTYYSEISSSYARGGTGKGFRHWTATRHNGLSASVRCTFSPSVSEVWIRAYFRWGPMSSSHSGYKKVYYMMGSGVDGHNTLLKGSYIGWIGDSGYSHVYGNLGGWTSTFIDNQWHCVEMYLNSPSGIRRLWIDGINTINATGPRPRSSSWSAVRILENNSINDGNAWTAYVDLDDIVITINTYNGFILDSRGRKMIGLTGAGSSPSRSKVKE